MNILKSDMTEEWKSRLKKVDGTIHCFLDEMKQKNLTSKKHKKVCMTLSYIQYLLFSVSLGLKICVITAGIKNYKSIIKKNRKKNMIKQQHFLAKNK